MLRCLHSLPVFFFEFYFLKIYCQLTECFQKQYFFQVHVTLRLQIPTFDVALEYVVDILDQLWLEGDELGGALLHVRSVKHPERYNGKLVYVCIDVDKLEKVNLIGHRPI